MSVSKVLSLARKRLKEVNDEIAAQEAVRPQF